MEQIRIDLVPGGVTPNAHASQYDVGRAIRFLLYNGGNAYTLAGTETITVDVTKPDGTTDTVSVTNTSSNYVDFVTTDGLINQAGLYPCEISIVNGTDVIGSQNFNLRAEADAYDGADIVTVTVGPADICTFTTTLAEPLQSVTVDVEASQDLHGYDHPWAGGAGKNKLPLDTNIIKNYNGGYSAWTDNEYTTNDVTFKIIEDTDNGVTEITANGTATADIVFRICYGTPYLVINNSITVVMQNTSRGGLKYDGVWTDVMPTPLTLANVTNIEEFWVRIASGTTLNNANITPMICLSTTVDYTYEPYSNICPINGYTEANITANGETVTISFGSTVYVGQLIILPDRTYFHGTHMDLDLGTLNYTYYSGLLRFAYRLDDGKPSGTAFGLDTALCECYPVSAVQYSNMPDDSIMVGSNFFSGSVGSVVIHDESYTSVPAIQTALLEKKLVYELATPFDIDLTPEVISAIVGENNVAADCGKTTVKYLKAGN